MQPDFQQLANESIRKLTPYQPGKPIEELERELGITSSIKLASNENPLGAGTKVKQAVQAAMSSMHIYPDGGGYELKQAISKFLSVKPNQITLGNGSENVLELIVKAYLNRDSSAVISEFAFLTIPILIKSYGARLNVATAKEWGHDVDAMINAIDKDTKVLFIVNPNNPTGTYINRKAFEKLLSGVPPHVLIVIDEAYSEYITTADYPNALEYLPQYPNMIISRTFSKVHGMAALRLGFAISSPEIADILNRARLPFNVNSLASKAGCAALLDHLHLENSVKLNNEGMQQLSNGLKPLNLDFIPSIGNFISVDVGDAVTVYQQLLHKGVIVRPLNAYNMPKHIRVSIGTKSEIDRFLNAIKETLAARA